jgi:hypothetical protein
VKGSNISQLREALWHAGIDRHERAVIMAAYAIAGRLKLAPKSGKTTWIAQLADRLPQSAPAAALYHAKEWLGEDLGLTDMPKRLVDNFWYAHPATSDDVDTQRQYVAVIMEELIASDVAIVPFEAARYLAMIVAPAGDSPCTCLFAATASVAWHLAHNRIVSFWPGEHRLAITLSLLAYAFQKNLHVFYRNPIDGSSMPIVDEFTQIDRDTPIPPTEHIIAFPPFGLRTETKNGRSLPIETLQLERFPPLASKSYCCVVSDGLLFRETRGEAELRAKLLADNTVSVTSLPMGIWGRTMNVASSLLQLRPGWSETVIFRNGRDLPDGLPATARPEAMISQLQRISRGELLPERQQEIPHENVLEANSILLPSRYVRSVSERALEDALADRRTIALEDVATIERSKAPVPSKHAPAETDIVAMEITPADIVDGEVRAPAKEVRFSADDQKRVAGITVEIGDIVVSIKGAVGIVGKVGMDALIGAVMEQPWVISQSLAVIRHRKNNFIATPNVLAAILTAPWVRERLSNLSGGSVVNTLPISALRSLKIPVPEATEIVRIKGEMEQIEAMRTELLALRRNLDERQTDLWEQLWNMKSVDKI